MGGRRLRRPVPRGRGRRGRAPASHPGSRAPRRPGEGSPGRLYGRCIFPRLLFPRAPLSIASPLGQGPAVSLQSTLSAQRWRGVNKAPLPIVLVILEVNGISLPRPTFTCCQELELKACSMQDRYCPSLSFMKATTVLI